MSKSNQIAFRRIVKGKIHYPTSMSTDAKDLIAKLCEVDPTKRLGNLKGRASDVKSHPWFKDIDWVKLYKREMKGPIIPQLKGNVSGASRFTHTLCCQHHTNPRLIRTTRGTLRITILRHRDARSTPQICRRNTTRCLTAFEPACIGGGVRDSQNNPFGDCDVGHRGYKRRSSGRLHA